MRIVLPLALITAIALAGCGGGHATSQSGTDGGKDAGNPAADGNAPDAGMPEASMPDASTADAGKSDAGTPDTTTADVGTPEANVEAGTPDAGMDRSMADAALDASSPDSGAADAGVDAATAAVFTCPGCASFPPPGAAACPPATLGPATLAYPLDGTLFPPNLGGYVEVQFAPPTGATLFEVDFENAITDVRVEALCNAITPVRGGASSGCGVTLTAPEWTAIAAGNRGGDPVQVTVRSTANGSCVSTSTAKVAVSFAHDDLTGTVAYWQSEAYGGIDGKTGGIYTYDFGAPAQGATPFYTPDPTNGRCRGCHTVSRDGARMALTTDDADGDDEYGDDQASVLDLTSRTVVGGAAMSPGFQTFTHDHGTMISAMFKATNKSFGVFDSNGQTLLSSLILLSGLPGTQPDLSPDDASLVFVAPAAGQISTTGDHHFVGSSLYVAPFNAGTPALGTPVAVLLSTAAGISYYYPSFSPDGAFVLYDHAPSGDVFHNPNARVELVHMPPAANAQPIDLPALNVANGLTNSWPRWSPSVQTYKGHRLLWVTFSSTRDYGLRLANQSFFNCYPPESPTYDTPQPLATAGGTYANCTQPQLWMGAVIVDPDTTLDATDRSFPAFWLPFQNVAHHNHTAQWTSRLSSPPPAPDGGACGETGAACGGAAGPCCADTVCCGTTCQPNCAK
jgi:hypothetical protein